MPVDVKSLIENAEQIKTDIQSKTNQTAPPLPVAYIVAVANAVSGMALTDQLHNIDQRKECFPQTASEFIGLPLWADLANRQREPGDQSELQALSTGTNGQTIGVGSLGPVAIAENGRLYDVKVGGTIAGGNLSITIIDRLSGEEGTLQVGSVLRWTTTLPGIDPTIEITAINVNGSNEELVESWRAAIIQKVAFPPNIGTSAWFYDESLSIAGITRVYPYVDEDFPGRVIIYAVDDSKVDGQPSAQQLLDIEAIYTTAGKDTMWATGTLPNLEKRIEALASPIEIYDVVITEGSPAISATLKTAIEISIDGYFILRNPYIKGLSLSDQGVVEKAAILTVSQNTIDAEVGETGRIDDIDLQKQGDAPANIYTLPIGTRSKANISYT